MFVCSAQLPKPKSRVGRRIRRARGQLCFITEEESWNREVTHGDQNRVKTGARVRDTDLESVTNVGQGPLGI